MGKGIPRSGSLGHGIEIETDDGNPMPQLPNEQPGYRELLQ
jgi:hypothetical protein